MAPKVRFEYSQHTETRLILASLALYSQMVPAIFSIAEARLQPSPQPYPPSIQITEEGPPLEIEILNVVNPNTPEALSLPLVHGDMLEATETIAQSTNGQVRTGKVTTTLVELEPEGVNGNDEACYTREQYDRLAAEERQKQETTDNPSIIGIAYNGTYSCDSDQANGWAIIDRDDPRFMANISSNTDRNQRTLAHETGHLLGVTHQSEISCTTPIKDMPYVAVGTVQQLTKRCQPEKRFNGEINMYASEETVMGSGQAMKLPVGGGGSPTIFSPPELLKLMPYLRAKNIEPEPGTYHLSYEDNEDNQFAVRMQLPENHRLKQIIPSAESILFAPIITYSYPGIEDRFNDPSNIVRIGAFVETITGDTFVFDTNPYRELPSIEENREGIELPSIFVYGDSQLNVAVMANTDSDGQYIRLLRLDDPEARQVMAQNMQWAHSDNNRQMNYDEIVTGGAMGYAAQVKCSLEHITPNCQPWTPNISRVPDSPLYRPAS